MQTQLDIDRESEIIRALGCFFNPRRIKTKQSVLDALINRQYISLYKGQYIITDLGAQYYKESCQNPKFSVYVHIWKDEARSGLKEVINEKRFKVSERTQIENAAIPRNKPPLDRCKTPEEILEENRRVIKLKEIISNELNTAMPIIEELLAAGRIKICGDHIGIFDGDSKVCRRCVKRQKGRK